ncbi:LruC domain-containing protein [Bacteroides sp.]
MKQNVNGILAISLFLFAATFTGCVDSDKDLFDAEKVKEEYQNSFPVKDVDPDMNWKTTRSATVNITVNEDQGETYKVRIFDANPLSKSGNAKLLAEGYANQTTSFKTQMDYPASMNAVYVLRTDAHNRHLLKYASIENGQVNANFGFTAANTRATRATTNNDIEKLEPCKAESDIKSLASKAEELEPNTTIKAGDVYKISKNEVFRGKIYTDGIWSGKRATVIIEGTWDPQGNLEQIEQEVDLFVMNGGKIIIPKKKTLSLNGSTAITVYKGGNIEGEEDSKIYSANATKENYNYNAGTINIGELHYDGSNGIFYNCGTMTVEKLNYQNVGARLINQGHITAKETSEHLTLENGCYARIESFNGHLKQGNSCALYVKDYNPDKHWGRTLSMGKNSMFVIGDNAELEGTQFTGPTDGYALIKIDEVESIQGFKSSGNIYYEINEIDDDISTESWMKPFFDALRNSEGTISKYGESPITIPAGDCTGEGNNVNEDGSDIDTTPITYTYAFEDNYPYAGDYDFNDIVLNVSSKNEYKDEDKTRIKEIKYKITLAAVGANKKLGAGLRLVGINKNDIKEIKFDGDKEDFRDNTLPNSMFENATTESKGNEIVIPLFGDAHRVYGLDQSDRPFINTQTPYNGKLKTLEIIVVPQNGENIAIGKDNLDFFIAYDNRGTRTEIHLYEFRDAKATANGTIHQENLDAAGNYTWAICVPEFKYAVERTQITKAYPEFSLWATTGGQNEAYAEWYKKGKEEFIFK